MSANPPLLVSLSECLLTAMLNVFDLCGMLVIVAGCCKLKTSLGVGGTVNLGFFYIILFIGLYIGDEYSKLFSGLSHILNIGVLSKWALGRFNVQIFSKMSLVVGGTSMKKVYMCLISIMFALYSTILVFVYIQTRNEPITDMEEFKSLRFLLLFIGIELGCVPVLITFLISFCTSVFTTSHETFQAPNEIFRSKVQ